MTRQQVHDEGDPVARRQPARYAWFAAARIAVGLYWLYEQHWKLPPDFGLYDARGLMFAFDQSIEYPTVGLYRAFLQKVVVPHFHLFGWLLGISEVAIGASLVLGALTRLGALLAVLQSVNLLIAQGRTPEGPWIYAGILAANLFVLFTPSNRRLSVDSRLAAKFATKSVRSTLLTRLRRLASS